MDNLDFIKKLYNGKNCYSDHMSEEQLELLHLKSEVEKIIVERVNDNKIVFLTGNPGDGKTFIIQAIKDQIDLNKVYVERDLNTVSDYVNISKKIIDCYNNSTGAIIAVNEYPFYLLLKSLKQLDKSIGDRIQNAKDSFLIYGTPNDTAQEGHFYVIDLNYRNLLYSSTSESEKAGEILDNMCRLISGSDLNIDSMLKYNVLALSNDYVKSQLTRLVSYTMLNNEHFAARDIMGAFSYIITSRLLNDSNECCYYYDAIFEGSNSLLAAIQQYDPIYLSTPKLDEDIWNGEDCVKKGWLLSCPETWPNDTLFNDDVDEAIKCFKSIKRKYFFENENGQTFNKMLERIHSKEINFFKDFENNKKQIKRDIVSAINKIFLKNSDENRDLNIWTTHRYDLSFDSSTAISSKYVDSRKLELVLPRPIKWAEKMEYVPNHIVLKPKKSEMSSTNRKHPQLVLDVDFLRSLQMVNNGYPVALLPTQYEQSVSMFLKQLEEMNLSEENDGQFVIVNRKTDTKMCINIENNKYNFE